jgi:hypothetical protein
MGKVHGESNTQSSCCKPSTSSRDLLHRRAGHIVDLDVEFVRARRRRSSGGSCRDLVTDVAACILAERDLRPFASFADFLQRTGVSPSPPGIEEVKPER